MEITTTRFILAASAASLYVLLLAAGSAIFVDGSRFAIASLYQWSLGSVLVFMFVSFMGGLLALGVSKVGPDFYFRMSFLICFGWAITPITYGRERIESLTGAIVDVVLHFVSAAVAFAIFYFIAFKRVEAEAADV